jgi:hypothetical protein
MNLGAFAPVFRRWLTRLNLWTSAARSSVATKTEDRRRGASATPTTRIRSSRQARDRHETGCGRGEIPTCVATLSRGDGLRIRVELLVRAPCSQGFEGETLLALRRCSSVAEGRGRSFGSAPDPSEQRNETHVRGSQRARASTLRHECRSISRALLLGDDGRALT